MIEGFKGFSASTPTYVCLRYVISNTRRQFCSIPAWKFRDCSPEPFCLVNCRTVYLYKAWSKVYAGAGICLMVRFSVMPDVLAVGTISVCNFMQSNPLDPTNIASGGRPSSWLRPGLPEITSLLGLNQDFLATFSSYRQISAVFLFLGSAVQSSCHTHFPQKRLHLLVRNLIESLELWTSTRAVNNIVAC